MMLPKIERLRSPDLPAPRMPVGISPLSLLETSLEVSGMPDVYYSPDTDNFYSRTERRGMGDAFYRANIHLMRRAGP
jgi:hypothetical protein